MRRCEKGKPCGATCIERRDICRKDSPDSVSNSLGQIRYEVERVKESRRGRGQSLAGENVDVNSLMKQVDKWVEDHGLRKTGDKFTYAHDSNHILVKDYLGMTGEKLAKYGKSPGKGPSAIEELVVSAAEFAAEFKRMGSSMKEIREMARDGKLYNFWYPLKNLIGEYYKAKDSPERVYQEKILERSYKIANAMVNSPNFEKLVDTINAVREQIYAMPDLA